MKESQATVQLFQGLQAARISGSDFMEEGERDDLADFNAASKAVDTALATSLFDERDERAGARRATRDWRAAVQQLRATPIGVGTATDDATDPEDVFEEHVNDAIGERRAARGGLRAGDPARAWPPDAA